MPSLSVITVFAEKHPLTFAVLSRAMATTISTGIGKELIARAIHDVSGYPGKFVAVDVSGLDDTLFLKPCFLMKSAT